MSLSLTLLYILWLTVIHSAGGAPQVITITRILQVGKELAENEEGYIIYPTVDRWRDRNVAIACKDDVTFSSMPTTPSADGLPRFNVSASVTYVRPECAGRLTVCVAPDTYFRKHSKTVGVSCARYPKMLMPHPEVTETVRVAMYTWYMGQSNYEEMRDKGSTTVYIPYLEYYSLPVFVTVYQPVNLKYECYFKTPNKSESKITDLNIFNFGAQGGIKEFTVFHKEVPAISSYAGEYSVRCRGVYYYTPTRSLYWSPWVTQTLKLIMFEGIQVHIRNYEDMYIRVLARSVHFIVDVLTTSEVTEFHVERSDGKAHGQQIFVEFIAYHQYTVTAEYQVSLPWIAHDIAGIYTISVTNKDKEQSSVNLKVDRARGLRVLVSPHQQIVGEGARVSFDCVVLGYPIETIGWIRDYQGRKMSPDVEITELSGEKGGLRLTFISPRLGDSGYYTCFAANKFVHVRKQARVELAVFLPGSLYIDPNYKAPESVFAVGEHVLNISEEEILKELGKFGDDKKGVNGVAIGLSVGFVVAIITAGAVLAIFLGRMVYRKRQHTSTTKGRKTLEKIPLRQESRLRLIPNTFDSELDLVKEWLGSDAEISERGSDEQPLVDNSHEGDIEGILEGDGGGGKQTEGSIEGVLAEGDIEGVLEGGEQTEGGIEGVLEGGEQTEGGIEGVLEGDDDGGEKNESGARKKGKGKAKDKKARKGNEPDHQGVIEDGITESKGRGSSKKRPKGRDKDAKARSSEDEAEGKDVDKSKSSEGQKGDRSKSSKGHKGDKSKSSEGEKGDKSKSSEGQKGDKSKSSEGQKGDKSKGRTKEGKAKGSESKKIKGRDEVVKSSKRKCEDESGEQVKGKESKLGDKESSQETSQGMQ